MILGMPVSAFTSLHVVLSLIGIVTGLVVVADMFGSRRRPGWTVIFLATTIVTSVTGFLFPRNQVLPSHIVGVLSLVALAVALLALYRYRLERYWRWIYVATALVALYFNVFVAIVQAFQKVAFLNALASTQSDPPFIITQLIVLVAFVAIAIVALKSFHPDASVAQLRPLCALEDRRLLDERPADADRVRRCNHDEEATRGIAGAALTLCSKLPFPCIIFSNWRTHVS